MINVGTVWNGPASEDNGAYGLYPVKCTNILIDNCYVKGASDAGIYVGQSEFAIVRNSTAELNVAGIEIENTISADVYGNTAQGNTGGILVFDLPDLAVSGSKTRVFDNTIVRNDHENFAPEGNIVASVPAGTGVMIMSTKQVEIFDNDITNNNVLGVGVVSYLVLQEFDSTLTITDANYDPYASGINVHDNTFLNDGVLPANNNEIGSLITLLFLGTNVPDVLFDGIFDPNRTLSETLCVKGNGSAGFVNLDAENNFANMSQDATPHDCTPASLPAVTVNAPGI